MNKITKDMTIKEIFLDFPEKANELAETLALFGVKCVSCCASAWETLEEGLKSHGISDEDITKIVDKLNLIVQS